MKYFFYWYSMFGAPCSGKRTSDTSLTPLLLQQYEITKEEYDKASLAQLAVKYPFLDIPDLT